MTDPAQPPTDATMTLDDLLDAWAAGGMPLPPRAEGLNPYVRVAMGAAGIVGSLIAQAQTTMAQIGESAMRIAAASQRAAETAEGVRNDLSLALGSFIRRNDIEEWRMLAHLTSTDCTEKVPTELLAAEKQRVESALFEEREETDDGTGLVGRHSAPPRGEA